MDENNVDIGFIEAPKEPWHLHRCYFPSKVGGKPAWLNPEKLPSTERLRCSNCSKPMVFLLQVYAPDDDESFHRTIYIFCCKNGSCYKTQDNSPIKAMSCSLPRYNNFYPHDPPDYDTAHAAKNCKEQRSICHVCGCFGRKTCSRCKNVNYCGKEHQTIDWKNHKLKCNMQPCNAQTIELSSNYFLFPENEIVIESEEAIPKESDVTPVAPIEETQNSSFSIDDLNDAVRTQIEDKAFEKFKKKISVEPEQIIRYEKNGKPLWCSDHFVPTQEDIPKCSCGAERKFEFQILPYLLTYLKVDTSIAGPTIDWGTISIFTCSVQCNRLTCKSPYLTEFIWKQNYSKE